MIQHLAFAADGSSVVYSRRTIEDNRYRSRLWRVVYEGGRSEQLTTAAATDSRPRFSPDGRRLLFLSDRSGSTQPWVLPLSGGEPHQAAAIDGDVGAAEWAPDGRRIALIAPSGEQRFVVGDKKDPIARRITAMNWRLDDIGMRDQFKSAWVATVGGSRARRVSKPSFEVTQVFWTPDGRVGFLADQRPDADLMEEERAYSVPASGGQARLLATLQGAILQAVFSPSGKLVVIGVDRKWTPEWSNLNLYLISSGEHRRLGDGLDRGVAATSYGDLIDPDSFVSEIGGWLDDENMIALVSDRGRSLPYRFGLDGTWEPLAQGDFICTACAVSRGRVVVVANQGGNAAEVYAVEDGSLRPLTSNGSRWLGPWRRDPEALEVSHPDGHSVDAWLVAAKGRRSNRPLVIQVHGGPHASYGPTPWLEMLALAEAGIHVMYSNPRGSLSYGEEFARSLHGRWGDPDGSDLLALVDWAINKGLTSAGKIGILGLSYGGFMVNWMLGHFTERFAAGVSENPVTDMVSELGGSDFGTLSNETAVGLGNLPEDIDEFLRRSPYTKAHKMRAPLLLLQSEQDLRCPAIQSELVFAMLRQRGRTVEMVRYPGESHYLAGIGRPDRRIDRIERIVDWFSTHLINRRSKSTS
jgi:dipeptidyl aminopeptidase/acylaminoacyl peptidase